MTRLYSRHNDLYLNAVRSRPNEWKRLLWAMSMFHGVLQGRATYGALVRAFDGPRSSLAARECTRRRDGEPLAKSMSSAV
jgi:hypothetical protein